MIVGGWPCQDLSPFGLKKGLQHGTRSGLVSEVYRLADELKPKAIFLENVPAILGNGMDQLIREFVAKRGYEMRWAVIPASSVGAPHTRSRFFCLLVRPGWSPGRAVLSNYKPMSWSREPKRMVPYGRPGHHRRCQLMGNSVVPDCVRAAFLTLATCFEAIPSRSLLASARSFSVKHMDRRKFHAWESARGDATLRHRFPKWGIAKPFAQAEVQALSHVEIFDIAVPAMKRPQLDLVFDPSCFRKSHGAVAKSSPPIQRPQRLSGWSTPRRTSGVSGVLTQRTIRDLPTQVRFEVSTPDEARSGNINPRFVEWLMGYRTDWTRTQTV
jgi:hypothetical protein